MENIKLQTAYFSDVPRDILCNIRTQVRLFQPFQDSCLANSQNLYGKDR